MGLAEANARVGSIISDAVGGEGAELETLVGEVFHAFIAELELQTPLNPLLLSLRSVGYLGASTRRATQTGLHCCPTDVAAVSHHLSGLRRF